MKTIKDYTFITSNYFFATVKNHEKAESIELTFTIRRGHAYTVHM